MQNALMRHLYTKPHFPGVTRQAKRGPGLGGEYHLGLIGFCTVSPGKLSLLLRETEHCPKSLCWLWSFFLLVLSVVMQTAGQMHPWQWAQLQEMQ